MEMDQNKHITLKGIGVSPGFVIGKVYLVDRGKIRTPRYYIKKSIIGDEIKRFKNAIESSRTQLKEVRTKLSHEDSREIIYILDAHRLMLEDKLLIKGTIDMIRDEEINAEWALERVLGEIKKIFDHVDDPYLRERKSDIDYVGDRILRNLVKRKADGIQQLKEDVIIVAHDLSPADTAQMAKEKVLGFATDVGGRTSHTAIMARALEIPAVVGLENITEKVNNNDIVIIDGMNGIVIVGPTSDIEKEYSEKRNRYYFSENELLSLKDVSAVTTDGYQIKMFANIELIDEIPSILKHGAEGIGLYRTEFLYMNRNDLPSEEEHFQNYQEAVEKVKPAVVTIRTLDIGGDKFISPVETAKELNPAMGLRAIRFCLREVEIFKAQLKGSLRASYFGNLRVMFPMISGLNELLSAKQILDDSKEELRKNGIPFDEKIKVGIMIETPSACLTAENLAKEADFFSIGTNDLIQYSLAIDRVNEHVAYLYEPLHPAILRMIRDVVVAGHKTNIPVGMCGEMAGEIAYILILIGFGLDDLSMNALSIPRIKRIIRSVSYKEAKEITDKIFQLNTAREIEEFLRIEMYNRFPDIFENYA